jgi:hypothetical protein
VFCFENAKFGKATVRAIDLEVFIVSNALSFIVRNYPKSVIGLLWLMARFFTSVISSVDHFQSGHPLQNISRIHLFLITALVDNSHQNLFQIYLRPPTTNCFRFWVCIFVTVILTRNV